MFPRMLAGPFELESTGLGALPVIDRFLARIDLAGTLERHLPAADARTTLPAATAVGVLVAQPVRGARAALRPGRLGRRVRAGAARPRAQGGGAAQRRPRRPRPGPAVRRRSRLAVVRAGAATRSASSGSTAASCTTTPRRSCCTATTSAADGHQRGGKPTVDRRARSFQGSPSRSQAAGADPDRHRRRRGSVDASPRGGEHQRRSAPTSTRGTSCAR